MQKAVTDTTNLKKRASQGDSQAQYNLGKKCLSQNPPNHATAFDWFTKAAEAGHCGALNKLGLAYQHGLGIAQNPQSAFDCYTEAANSNNAEAQFHLGSLYYYGTNSLKKDYTMAYTWFVRAANSNNASAQNALGFMYQRGWGVSQDYEQALRWFTKAASENSSAQNQLGVYYKKGLGGLQVDYRTALDWYSKSAHRGNSSGQCNLAWMYFDGHGTKQNYAKALKWFLTAAENRSPEAQFQAGIMYLNGLGIAQADYVLSSKYFSAAVENGHRSALKYKDYVRSLMDNQKVQVHREEGQRGSLSQCTEVDRTYRQRVNANAPNVSNNKAISIGGSTIVTHTTISHDY